MKLRLNPQQAAPETIKAMIALEDHLVKSGLQTSLYHLVKTRASQINGCAYCIHMHTKDARTHGETEERLYLLDAWRESPLYSERERAALAWTESLTLIAETHAPDDVFDAMKKALQRRRDREAHRPHRRHQCLEPHRHQLPRGASGEGNAGCLKPFGTAETDMKRSLRTLAWFAAALSAAILQPAITSASAAEAETVKNVIAQQLPNVPGGKTPTHHHAGSALVAPDDATLTAPGGK